MLTGDSNWCEYCHRRIKDTNTTDIVYKRCSCGATAIVQGSSAVWFPQQYILKFNSNGGELHVSIDKKGERSDRNQRSS